MRPSAGLMCSVKELKNKAKGKELTEKQKNQVVRSPAARREFVQQHPCPAAGKPTGACPGYVVDHVKALACGGADSPSNMEWQTVADAKAKDKWERIGCR